MKARILSKDFRWIAASTHTDPSLFAARQRERMIAAQRQRVEVNRNVKVIGKRKG